MVEEVEELIEGYFMQFDATWNKLRTLNQMIEDTEDFVTIQLDSNRNQVRIRERSCQTGGALSLCDDRGRRRNRAAWTGIKPSSAAHPATYSGT